MRDSLAVPAESRAHGVIPVRGGQQVALSPLSQGRFGRIFRKLSPAPLLQPDQLVALAATMRDEDPPIGWNGTMAPRDNPNIPAGYTYFGQFIDHDITFDPASSLQRQNDIDALVDFRSPRFDLDSLYGSGPADEPFQYVRGSKGLQLLVEPNRDGIEDLPRNSQDVALLGDPRNDENIIVGQLQLIFLKLHNRVGAEVADDASVPEEAKFETAQQRVRWLYQWVVLVDYIQRIVGKTTFDAIVDRDRHGRIRNIVRPIYQPTKNPFMPVEFSAAAFRFGHSMIRGIYDLNGQVRQRPIFTPGPMTDPLADLRGFRRLPQAWTADWPLFFDIGGSSPQPSRLIDGRIVPPLFELPVVDGEPSLPVRNLTRGQALGLPGGQDVARKIGVQVISGSDIGAPEPTPLWFYLLREAEALGDGGKHLGPAGGAIVGQVLAGLLELDPTSWLSVDRNWTPPHPSGGDFAMPDLIEFALGH
jgi:hypothetical protein